MNKSIHDAIVIAWMRGWNSAEIARLVNLREDDVVDVIHFWRHNHHRWSEKDVWLQDQAHGLPDEGRKAGEV